MTRLATLLTLLAVAALVPTSCRPEALRVGSKKFTESVILGELLTGLAESTGTPTEHVRELGGTRVLYSALTQGQIDVYPEYTGTIRQELLAGPAPRTNGEMRQRLAEQGIRMSAPLGFNNTYALAMRRSRASELNVTTISDLAQHPRLRLAFSHEFLDRGDGWPNLKKHYGLPHQRVAGIDHDIAYRQLAAASIDVIDVYTTDAKIKTLDLVLLTDDRQFFPRYDAVLLFRADLPSRYSAAYTRLMRLPGSLSARTMVALNHQTEVAGAPERTVARQFLQEQLDTKWAPPAESRLRAIARNTAEHLNLVRQSLVPAIFVAIPLGVGVAKLRRMGPWLLGAVGVVQTIPALALLVLLMPLTDALGFRSLGAGTPTAIAALFLYSLLPIVQNTAAGLNAIPANYQETALALGLPWRQRLFRIELPLASSHIMAGIKTAAVLNVGFATLGALIGAGGYGQPILTGIRLLNTGLILQGAIPAALLALATQACFTAAESWVVPAGLRIREPAAA